jgi:hypothetical protein
VGAVDKDWGARLSPEEPLTPSEGFATNAACRARAEEKFVLTSRAYPGSKRYEHSVISPTTEGDILMEVRCLPDTVDSRGGPKR